MAPKPKIHTANNKNQYDYVKTHYANVDLLKKSGSYNEQWEHDNCGVGMVVSIDGTPSREVVVSGIEALKVLFHRGAVDADGKTGDGAGIHLELPQRFFEEHISRTGHEIESEDTLAVGMVFLPKSDLSAQETCRTIVEKEVLAAGYKIYGWRQVPVNISVIGEKANATCPEIEQIMLSKPKELDKESLERDLYVVRRTIEKQVKERTINDFYICSLSCRSIIYKGMFVAEQLSTFYPDLLDEKFISSFAIYHQRYSTNTFPTWRLAQPFRMLAHNGEINTLLGNINWMKAHECRLESRLFGARIEDVKPIIQNGSSDSEALDAAFELLCRGGRDAAMTKSLLIPESISQNAVMPKKHKALFSYCNAVMEPWDGPAALCATDGRWIIAGVDRNGLRPMRYTLTKDNLLIVGSETGMLHISDESVIEKGRVGPGQTIAVDLKRGIFYRDTAVKDMLADKHQYQEWCKNTTHLETQITDDGAKINAIASEELRRRQISYGITMEDLELILHPMAIEGKEATGSMGDDTPLAVLSDNYRGLHSFFRQNFSQVTNPPIDSLRETRVMTLNTRLGNLGNILDEDSSQCELLQLESPVLTNAQYRQLRKHTEKNAAEINCVFDPASNSADDLRAAILRIQKEAEDAVRKGCTHVVLSDHDINEKAAPIPMIIATGAVHTHLTNQKLRTFTSLIIRSGECIDTHYFAVLIGVGATAVNAYLAEATITNRHKNGLFKRSSIKEIMTNYKKAIDEGLKKIMSKMGISVISSYRGGYNFEAIGLSRALVAEFFPGMTSRISGIGILGIQKKVREQHHKGYLRSVIALPVGGFYRYRANSGDVHSFDGRLIHTLQAAVKKDSYQMYQNYSSGIHKLPPIHIRDLLDFRPNQRPIAAENVESTTEIRKRFVTPGMSLGALSPEAHGTLNIAMNRIGAKSDSGEGGEDKARYKPAPNGDNANSAIKQIASGRFGVTAEYLNQCREIEIKVAQGAKPGEGGQLPAFKVTKEIAKLRHATKGVMLISPPPHHDIYSIEDLAQLIYDLKQINPRARVTVKLVARTGIGTIAAGVAKANADTILISGHNGGTGASPQTSIKYAGLPWELGLTEVHQVLTLNKLRHKIALRTDGGLKTGRDIVMAAMMGAEEFGIGTSALIAMGCILVRQCHSNTCPVGVCTQDKDLIDRFSGKPEHVVNLMTFLAEEVREILGDLGFASLNEVIGRTDLLQQVSRGSAHLDDLDLNPLLVRPDSGGLPTRNMTEGRNEVPETLDAQMIIDAAAALEDGEKMQLTYNVNNTQRAIGTKLSHKIVTKYGLNGLQPGHISIKLRGSCGQSLGAFGTQGLKLDVLGDSNDYVGKGLSGATIIIRPAKSPHFKSHLNTIIGNTVLYGATSGKLYAAGQAGERFCVRNSGATAIVEGCGSNGCEYMTGGQVVILGSVGPNFGAGMTGGMAFIYDVDQSFKHRVNAETIIYQRIEVGHYETILKNLIISYQKETASEWAERILAKWDKEVSQFWQIVPKEMLQKLEIPVSRPAPERIISA